ncbi:hypothetical protein L5849_14625 [Erythrobacter sp. SN021]|uniref:hypothetical protein n=1 Tax=Erythrobacter sp. SN021 TaxID=2912574 RepID=UPI001F334D75|nr:hypothetical protein [Erythrobacter sp. SN021]MCF8883936.1 hypothetical protein [Erythrobacter sp. SN021]
MTTDIFLTLILVPVFVIGLQKYIEVRASYTPPSEADILKVEEASGATIARIIRAVPKIRIVILVVAILLLYVFGFVDDSVVKWSAIGGVAVCVIAMSALVNWHLAYDV